MEKYSAVGRFSKLFGAGGELYANLHSSFPEAVNKEEPLFVKIDELMVPLFLSKFNRRGQKGVVLAFDDIDNQTRAEELIGLEIYLPDEKIILIEDDEADSFVGFNVVINGSIKGVIEAFVESKMNPLFSVLVDGREVLIPANEEFITGLDAESNCIDFELPEGLLELYIEE